MRSVAEVENYSRQLQTYSSLDDFRSAIFDASDHLDILIFLLFGNLDYNSWHQNLAGTRSAYESLRSYYLRPIENADEVDSLAEQNADDDQNTPSEPAQTDEDVREEIFQDVARCMPENTYFRQPDTQRKLLDILFVYTKLNPDVGYRQGMHELLAPVLWAVDHDAVIPLDTAQVIPQVLNFQYIEHDAFTLFSEIMRKAKAFYDPGTGTQPGNRTSHGGESEMLMRCKHIYLDLLPQCDPGLAAHLEELDISPQIFLLRWIRLIFGREFPFNDSLQVWDLIFAQDTSLEIIDYICVAMLLRIRWQLIEADTNEALTLLMRYPSPTAPNEPRSLVFDAQVLRDAPNVDTGNDLIKKYSGRVPPPFKRIVRPYTPDYGSRSATPASHRVASPFASPGFGLDSFLNEAAKGVIDRGEKWGLNQALRDAVGEMRKNVQNLQQGRSPRSSLLGPNYGHRRNQSSEMSGNIAANMLRKINALEARNKQLARMLELAVSDLWEVDKAVTDDKTLDQENHETMKMAVAKVQFVQVFLQDSTLPLPQENESQPDLHLPGNDQIDEQLGPEVQRLDLDKANITRPPPPAAVVEPSPFPLVSRTQVSDSPPPSLPTISLSSQHASASVLSSSAPTSLKPPFQDYGQPQRRRLDHSSFSWMLDATSTNQPIARASTAELGERRHRAGSGRKEVKREKAFLFGEDKDDVVGERRVVRGKTRDLRKAGKDSKAPEGEREDLPGSAGEADDVEHGPI